MKLLIEAIVVGIATVLLGIIVGSIVGAYLSLDISELYRTLNKKYFFKICLFFTGFFLHLICEYLNINRWYCKNGNACQ
tara:strand:- start:152 stop:388 length:237 start_codon:yes stop_codon:yes gene_type:complete